jgi:hypothetical protein
MIFATLAYAQRLKSVGFTDAQAEALAEANREMIAEDMVTKTFLHSELAALRTELRTEISQVRTELRGEMNQPRAELRSEMKELEMRLTLRMGAIGVATVAALAAIIKL